MGLCVGKITPELITREHNVKLRNGNEEASLHICLHVKGDLLCFYVFCLTFSLLYRLLCMQKVWKARLHQWEPLKCLKRLLSSPAFNFVTS